jgi:hypothetical protein
MKEDPGFFKEFDWLQDDLGLKQKATRDYVEKYHFVTETEIEEIEKYILSKRDTINHE